RLATYGVVDLQADLINNAPFSYSISSLRFKIYHTLTDIVFLIILAVITGFEGWEGIEGFGEGNWD
nr:transposase family protein [Vibrio sp. F13]